MSDTMAGIIEVDACCSLSGIKGISALSRLTAVRCNL